MRNKKNKSRKHSRAGGVRESNGTDYNFDKETLRNKEVCELFFLMKDKRYVSIVNELFRMFSLPQIAEGLYRKYKVVPIEWKDQLDRDEDAAWPGIEWYTEAKKKKFYWFDENLIDFPFVSDKIEFPNRESDMDKIIDELLENERMYYDRLNYISTSFAGELEAIAQGKLGPEAKEALGLNTHQIEYAFGTLLNKLVETVSVLINKLDALVVVPTEPSKIEGGRGGVIADIFIEMADQIRTAYGPYNARYLEAKKLLEHRVAYIHKKQRPHTPPGGMRFLSFDELWKEATTTKISLLANKTFDTILGSPIKTFTNYQLYLKTLLKQADKKEPVRNDVTVEKLKKAVDVIKVVLEDVDAYVKKQEEIELKASKAMRK